MAILLGGLSFAPNQCTQLPRLIWSEAEGDLVIIKTSILVSMRTK